MTKYLLIKKMMMTTVIKQLAVGVTVFTSVLLISAPSFADTKYTSKDGNLVIQYGNKCSTVKPTGFYRVRNGATGQLIALDCTNTGGDVAVHKFVDTSGKERCYGRMTQSWGRGVATVWEIQGAVSGYPCSQAGKTFEVEMDNGKQI